MRRLAIWPPWRETLSLCVENDRFTEPVNPCILAKAKHRLAIPIGKGAVPLGLQAHSTHTACHLQEITDVPFEQLVHWKQHGEIGSAGDYRALPARRQELTGRPVEIVERRVRPAKWCLLAERVRDVGHDLELRGEIHKPSCLPREAREIQQTQDCCLQDTVPRSVAGHVVKAAS